MDAIKVPNPPRFTPKTRSEIFFVNPLNKSAAGTLLIIWLVTSPIKSSRPSTKFSKAIFIEGILDIFPVKIKNPTKVKSKK